MEPYFDQYLPNVTMNGGVPVYLPIRPPPPSSLQETKLEQSASDWYIDMQELEAKITPRTKFLILNTPHNPIGKVFSITELMELGRLAQKHDFLILSDEVVWCFICQVIIRSSMIHWCLNHTCMKELPLFPSFGIDLLLWAVWARLLALLVGGSVGWLGLNH